MNNLLKQSHYVKKILQFKIYSEHLTLPKSELYYI